MQNDMRDRLINLIIEAMPYSEIERQPNKLADYLIANGVIVLDMNVISPENRPLITHIANMPLDDVIELIEQKLKEMRVENGK